MTTTDRAALSAFSAQADPTIDFPATLERKDS